MKFTKTAIALAVVGIAATPMMASADTTLSGILELHVKGSDADPDPAADPADPDPADPTVATGDVNFAISTEHELNSGLTGYGNMRTDVDSLSNASVASPDSVYVGIKGGFGDFRLGEIPLAVEYGQVANDIYDVGGEIAGGLSYEGNFGPVGLVANFSPENNSNAVGLGAKFGVGGFSVGLGFEDRDELTNAAAGVSFAFAGASIAAHFWTQERAGAADDLESISVKVGYGFGGVSANLTASTLEGEGADSEAIRLDLAYGLGGGMAVSTRITAHSDNLPGGEDLTEWRIQLAKSF